MLFFRILQHLLPDALAWRILLRSTQWFIGDDHTVGEPDLTIGGISNGRTIERFFAGLAQPPADARAFIDAVYLDLFPSSTRQLAEWENEFGLAVAAVGTDRRARLAAEWRATGGQSPRYLQDVVRAAGFDVYIHEWWASGPSPYVARDPRLYTTRPIVGTVQCGEPLALCGEVTALCNNFLANDPGYLVNKTPTYVFPPPPVPDDPKFWPYFLYWGGATFPARAQVLASRRGEFERLILKLCPMQQWLVELIDWVDVVPPPTPPDDDVGSFDFSDPDQSGHWTLL